MIAYAQAPARPIDQRTNEIAADALLRIPVAHFHSMSWAKQAISQSLTVVDRALNGAAIIDDQWMRELVEDPRADSMTCVFSAVCSSVISDAMQHRPDVISVTRRLSSLERDAYVALAAHRAHKDVNAMHDADVAELADSFVRVVQMHDNDTAVHLDATGALARRIALALGLSTTMVRTIELAARLHDIGKVGVSADIINKVGPLTDAEWAKVRMHAEIGAAVLADTPKLAHLAPIVRAHHERVDGTGYPDRLRGDEIPLEARVVAVADAFHAMTTQRSYSRAMLPSEALDVLAQNAGTQFDVNVVEATFELFRFVPRAHRAIA